MGKEHVSTCPVASSPFLLVFLWPGSVTGTSSYTYFALLVLHETLCCKRLFGSNCLMCFSCSGIPLGDSKGPVGLGSEGRPVAGSHCVWAPGPLSQAPGISPGRLAQASVRVLLPCPPVGHSRVGHTGVPQQKGTPPGGNRTLTTLLHLSLKVALGCTTEY